MISEITVIGSTSENCFACGDLNAPVDLSVFLSGAGRLGGGRLGGGRPGGGRMTVGRIGGTKMGP